MIFLIGLTIFAAGIIVLLPNEPITYTSEVELDPGSYLFRGSLDGAGDYNIHSLRILADPISMHIVLKCGNNDFDIYAGFGYTPTESIYEFRGFAAGGEDFTVDTIQEGLWHMMVHSYSGSGQYELRIDIEY